MEGMLRRMVARLGYRRHDVARVIEETTQYYLRVAGLRVRKGLMLKQGTIVDSIIVTPGSTKNDSGTRDPEMHQTKKRNQWYCGMKAKVRAKGDRAFRVVKRQFGDDKERYRRLARKTAQLHALFAMANLASVGEFIRGVASGYTARP